MASSLSTFKSHRSPNVALAGHSTNLVGIPTGLLTSPDFNQDPLPLRIHGTREANSGLFARLGRCENLQEAGDVFQDYLSVVFGFEEEQRLGEDRQGRWRVRGSYLRLLQDWGFDSNNPQGAVLKGWVESRFGLFPTFHKQPLTGFGTPAWMDYVEEKMASRFHNNCIYLQLDLLFEFCQWAIAKFKTPARRHVKLYRGVDSLGEFCPLGAGNGREILVRLNNIVSFSADRTQAGQFGAYILETEVPVVKLLFFNDLLPRHPLRGEAEYLVIGGNYRVMLTV